MIKTITVVEATAILAEIRKGNLCIGVEFYRKEPKCLICGKRYNKSKAPASCCGAALSYITKDTCKFGVHNPGEGITKPGEGVRIGESSDDAFALGRLKYYSFTRVGDRTDEKKCGYRQLAIAELIRFTDDIKDVEYVIVHPLG